MQDNIILSALNRLNLTLSSEMYNTPWSRALCNIATILNGREELGRRRNSGKRATWKSRRPLWSDNDDGGRCCCCSSRRGIELLQSFRDCVGIRMNIPRNRAHTSVHTHRWRMDIRVENSSLAWEEYLSLIGLGN